MRIHQARRIGVLAARVVAVVGIAVVAGPAAAAAHAQVRDTLPAVCLGFSFGPWTPPLDWRGAGHGAPPDTNGLARTPENRDWAVNGMVGVEDSVLVLYPRWWPAGIAVTLPTRRPAPGDTILGRASALVADGRRANPTAHVRAWAVRCGGAGNDKRQRQQL